MELTRQTWKIFWEHTLKYKRQFITLMVCLPIAILVGGITGPLVYSWAIDKLTSGNIADLGFADFTGLIWIWAAIQLFTFVIRRVMGFIYTGTQPKIARDIEQRIFGWLQQMSYSFHVNRYAGALVAKTSRFVRGYERLMDNLYSSFGIMFYRILFTLTALLFISPMMALIIGVWLVLFMTLVIGLSIKKIPYTRRASAADSAVTARLADSLTNVLAIKAFGHEKNEQSEFNSISQDRAMKVRTDYWLSEGIFALESFLMVLTEIAVLYFSIQWVIEGTITIGTLALIQFYFMPIMRNLFDVGRIVRHVETSFADAAEMTQILNQKPEIQDKPTARELTIGKGHIVFDKVAFRYRDEDQDREHLFVDFSLDIAPGERIGIVGPSGSGKTTLTKMLLRFMDVPSGKILIDGVDITRVKQQSLRQQIAYVPQEPLLFHRSLKENIRYGNLETSWEKCLSAAKASRCDAFISQLPLGYDTLVGERGIKLSGGGKQRVAIARAMLKNAPILVLDEATSSLDSESEKLIQEALSELMKDRTAIVIAHRLSTIQKMDRIVVLDKGRIVEQGTHRQLLDNGSLYANLWTHQSGGFIT